MAGINIKQRLVAILAADAVGYSRLMAGDDRATVSALDASRAVFRRLIEANQGRVIDMAGDSVLAVFETATGAVTAALAIQQELAAAQRDTSEDRRMQFRVGIHLGEVIEKPDGSVYGDGVNIAARFEGLAEPGGIMVSDIVYGAVRDRMSANFENAGEHNVKNIARALRCYRVHREGISTGDSETTTISDSPEASDEVVDAAAEKASLAVLPFANMSGDTEQDYFADGITEDIITDISKVSGMFVIARNSSFTFKNQNVDIRDVGIKLGVRHVLEGSVRKAGKKVRINVQLIDAASGGHIWAERYDRDLEDIFEVQDEVTRRIVDALEVALTGIERTRRENLGKVDAQAYDYLIRGGTLIFQFTPEALVEARTMLERALEIDPGLAPAYAKMALLDCTEFVNNWNNPAPDYLERSVELARKGCQADKNEAHCYHALGIALMWLGELEQAEHAFQQAIELEPNMAYSYGSLGMTLDFAGHHRRAITQFKRALQLDPQFDLYIHARGRAHFALRQYEEAGKLFASRLVRSPGSDVSRAYLASVYGHDGRPDEARKLWQELMEINPQYTLEHTLRVLPYKNPEPLERFVDGLCKAGLPQ